MSITVKTNPDNPEDEEMVKQPKGQARRYSMKRAFSPFYSVFIRNINQVIALNREEKRVPVIDSTDV
jgi:hypothetical protein